MYFRMSCQSVNTCCADRGSKSFLIEKCRRQKSWHAFNTKGRGFLIGIKSCKCFTWSFLIDAFSLFPTTWDFAVRLFEVSALISVPFWGLLYLGFNDPLAEVTAVEPLLASSVICASLLSITSESLLLSMPSSFAPSSVEIALRLCFLFSISSISFE